ncbi:MAG: hypothetical protein JW839_00835 [Candidatus Lokiarchaeota archaeon]|nr:hypothetical protein [Candidatus Lokiarchaeota archaeon]
MAMIVGLLGAGLGAYSAFFQQPLAGIPGADGEDGKDGADATSTLVVGILDPDQGETVAGSVVIRALVAGSDNYTVSIMRNGSQVGTSVPFVWNTLGVSDGDYNITVRVTDVPSGKRSQDQVVCGVLNNPVNERVHYCASQAAISLALSNIGAGSGTIVITEDITLTSSITITAGGSYIVRGVAPSVVVDCNANRMAFSITACSSFLLQDLTIDASDLTSDTTSAIYINAPDVRVENVRVLGDAQRHGRGIYIGGTGVWVIDCQIEEMFIGIYDSASGTSAHISGNTIIDCDSGTAGQGMNILGTGTICEGNYIETCHTGVFINSQYCVVSDNILFQVVQEGIYSYAMNSTFCGNVIVGTTLSSASNNSGIIVASGSDYNMFSGNLVRDFKNAGAGTGIGIIIVDASCDENAFVGNTMLFNDVNYSNSGTNTYLTGNNYS